TGEALWARPSPSEVCWPKVMVPRQTALTFTPVRPSSRYSMPLSLILVADFLGDGLEISTVIRVLQRCRDPQELLCVDKAAAVGDLLDAGDHPALTLLDRAHELGGVQNRVRRAGVEPDEAAPRARAGLFAAGIDALWVDRIVLRVEHCGSVRRTRSRVER